jgi:SEC-C motif-containing protein
MTPCPCGSSKAFDDCCGPLLSGERPALTAEALLRSRYTAFTRHDIDYIERTIHPEGLEDFDRAAASRWATGSEWLGLEVLAVDAGGTEDDEGEVEFVARFVQDGKETSHHEVATFARHEGAWCFLDGHHPGVKTFVREAPKVGRNDPCPCGSGKKHKKCCGR